MAAALAIVSEDASPTLSPARTALADHLATVARARADLERASRPAERLRDQLRVSTDVLTAAEADLAAIDAQHAASIRDAAKNDAPIKLRKPPETEKAEAAIESARRTCHAVRAALSECDGALSAATMAVRNAAAQSDQLVMAVMVEEHLAALDRLARTYAEHEAALTEATAIRGAMFERARNLQQRAPDQAQAWFVAGNQMIGAVEKMLPVPYADERGAIARWLLVLDRLATDATASG